MYTAPRVASASPENFLPTFSLSMRGGRPPSASQGTTCLQSSSVDPLGAFGPRSTSQHEAVVAHRIRASYKDSCKPLGHSGLLPAAQDNPTNPKTETLCCSGFQDISRFHRAHPTCSSTTSREDTRWRKSPIGSSSCKEGYIRAHFYKITITWALPPKPLFPKPQTLSPKP